MKRWARLSPARMRRGWTDARRERRVAALTARTLTPPPPQAFASFGARSVIVPPARVSMPGAIHVGDDVVVHEHAWFSVVAAYDGAVPKLTIGDRTSIGAQSHIACIGEIEIGSDVLTAARIFIGDTYHGYEEIGRPVIDQPMAAPAKVTVGSGAFIGINAVILQGVTVGEQAYIGAGAVVTSDVEPRTVVVGNPARAVKRYDTVLERWRDVNGR